MQETVSWIEESISNRGYAKKQSCLSFFPFSPSTGTLKYRRLIFGSEKSIIGSSFVNNRTDLELIQQTLNGESEAFGQLIQRCQDAVYATALHSIKDFAIAQDVAQEAFIEAYRGLHKLRKPAGFPGWLHTITLRQCNRWQRKQRESTSIDDLDGPQPGAVRPDEELERRELRRIVLDAIASLPENAGEVVTMYYMDGLSYNEIAGFLSVPTSTVKDRLQMGRKQLKEELITMVEDGLKQNRPDKKFTEKSVG